MKNLVMLVMGVAFTGLVSAQTQATSPVKKEAVSVSKAVKATASTTKAVAKEVVAEAPKVAAKSKVAAKEVVAEAPKAAEKATKGAINDVKSIKKNQVKKNSSSKVVAADAKKEDNAVTKK